MIDLVWLICFYEILVYPITLVVGLISQTPGNNKISNAHWTRGGQFVRNATQAEILAYEAKLNTSHMYRGPHPLAYYYSEASFFAAAIIFLAYFGMFRGVKYPLPVPGWIIVTVFVIIHTMLHQKVVQDYISGNRLQHKYALGILIYKGFCAGGGILGMASQDLGHVLMVIDSTVEKPYVIYMFIVLFTWPIIYGIYWFLIRKQSRKKG